ncbi:MAG: ABC transporter substrate-binding protein [Rhodospirillales bacterium]|nr:ABC transporter substrate-binding protein [Rhodospirillales bacterium]MBO6786559.1 ABC transporter substrate-binding protein [Rhodospirillales bacterium]
MSAEDPTPTIVSLLPAATEIVCALGFQANLIGRSHECDYPHGVEMLPVCTRALISPSGTSAEIDAAVKHAFKNALSIYEVVTDELARLKPDVIVTQDQCEVCAVALNDVEAAVCDLLGNDAKIVSLHPEGLDKVYADINRVGAALNADDAAARLIGEMRDGFADVSSTATGTHPSVACIEWTDPLMAAGNWVPELVAIAGGRDPFGTPGAHAPWLEPARLFDEDPDVIVFMPCGFGLDRSEAEARALIALPEWQQLTAVKSGRVCATDANSYFNRPGPRLLDSARILAEILYPDDIAPTYKGSAWKAVG